MQKNKLLQTSNLVQRLTIARVGIFLCVLSGYMAATDNANSVTVGVPNEWVDKGVQSVWFHFSHPNGDPSKARCDATINAQGAGNCALRARHDAPPADKALHEVIDQYTSVAIIGSTREGSSVEAYLSLANLQIPATTLAKPWLTALDNSAFVALPNNSILATWVE